MKKLFAILFLLSLEGAHGESLELPISSINWQIRNHTLFSSTDNLDEPGTSPRLLRSETQLGMERGLFSAGVTLSNRLAVGESDNQDVPIYLEKKHLTFENDRWQWILGDSHQELGRGVALTLFRDETLGIDNTLEGISGKVVPEEGSEIRAFGGRVRSWRSPVALVPFPDPLVDREVWLAGAGLKTRFEETTLGAHYLLTLNRPLGQDLDKRWHTIGALIGQQLGPHLDIYMETNVMVREDLAFGTPNTTASASYGTLVFGAGSWKGKAEFREYRGFAYDFQRPPTMEEDIVSTLNFSDVTAAKFTVERRLGVYNSIRASLLMGNDHTVDTTFRHAVAAAKWKAGPVAVDSRLGYRWFDGQSQIAHGDIKAKIPTVTGQSVELGYRKLYSRTGLNLIPTTDDRNFFDLAYTFSSHWSLTVGAEYVSSSSTTKTFANAGLMAKYDAFSSRAFLGSTSGGPQCSGGICRMVPAYSGVMLEGSYAF